MDLSTFNIVKDLLNKYLCNELSATEQQQLDAWINESEDNRLFFKRIAQPENIEQELRLYFQSRNRIRIALKNKIPSLLIDEPSYLQDGETAKSTRVIYLLRKARWAAAAILLIAAGLATYWLMQQKKPAAQPRIVSNTPEIKPGKNGAVLQLNDGSQLVLDSMNNGEIATQNGVSVQLQNGRLAYNTAAHKGGIMYNTLSTPKGRQFQLRLPDGTLVWLNAGSSITYPTTFTGKHRLVKVTGEAYFEVAHNKEIPFRVNVDGNETVEVLGTHFNINAYRNEPYLLTTLLEGSVRVNSAIPYKSGQGGNGQSAILKPGEQAALAVAHSPLATHHSPLTIDHSPDTEKVLAWKNGMFNFDGAKLDEVMRQLERWYDIEVVYESKIPDITFGGKITKGVSLEGLLVLLQRAGVHFRLENRKLVISP